VPCLEFDGVSEGVFGDVDRASAVVVLERDALETAAEEFHRFDGVFAGVVPLGCKRFRRNEGELEVGD